MTTTPASMTIKPRSPAVICVFICVYLRSSAFICGRLFCVHLRPIFLPNGHEMNIEHQHPLRPLASLIRELRRDPEPRAFAFDHELDTFSPAFDHFAQREGRRGAPRHRAVEHLPVGGPPRVMNG